jgi:ribosomal-protein-alanine N-acetyltransferase
MLPTDPTFSPPFRTLETQRLSIRIDAESDYIKAFHTLSNNVLKTHFGITTEEELQTQKNKVIGGLTTYRTSLVFFHFIERSLDKVIGSFAFHNWYPRDSRSEIGYTMASDEYKNKGYMKEAFGTIINFGFEAMNLNRIEAFIHPDNQPSRRLVEQAGFLSEGHLHERYFHDGALGDALVYALLKKNHIQQPLEQISDKS